MGHMKKPSSRKIMFVDNDRLVRDSLKMFFSGGHSDILIFKSGEEGLNSLKYQQIDVVISDYFLPDMDGIRFLSRVGETHPHAVRILMATLTSDGLMHEVSAAGIDKFIEKPLTMAFLDTIINDLTLGRENQ